MIREKSESSSSRSSPPASRQLPSKPGRVWTVGDLREISAMVVKDPAALLRETDRRGLSPIAFAAFQAAMTSDSLLPLLSLLEPKEAETSQLDKVVTLLEQIAQSQIRIERRLVELESRPAVRALASPQPSRPAGAALRT